MSHCCVMRRARRLTIPRDALHCGTHRYAAQAPVQSGRRTEHVATARERGLDKNGLCVPSGHSSCTRTAAAYDPCPLWGRGYYCCRKRKHTPNAQPQRLGLTTPCKRS
eukprot:8817131-Pyramimonas_sp.AAC.1